MIQEHELECKYLVGHKVKMPRGKVVYDLVDVEPENLMFDNYTKSDRLFVLWNNKSMSISPNKIVKIQCTKPELFKIVKNLK